MANFTGVDYNESEVARCQEFMAACAYRYNSEGGGGWPGCVVFEAERECFAGTIRKKDYALTSGRNGSDERVYRIQNENVKDVGTSA